MVSNPLPPLDRRRVPSWLAPLCAMLTVLLMGGAIDYVAREELRRDARERVLQGLASTRARIEGTLTSNLFLLKGLAAQASLRPPSSQSEFEWIASSLLGEAAELRNVGAAPDLVIRYMYPLAGNEAALGLDYRANPVQRDAALRARDTGQIVLAGPLKLVQGGIGLIARVPVYTQSDAHSRRFWGLMSAVIDAEKIYRTAGLLDPDLELEIAIRGRDALGAHGEVFYGPAALFESDSVRLQALIPGGHWELAAVPRDGWPTVTPAVWGLRALVLLAAMLAGGMVAIVQRSARERSDATAALERGRQRLADAIESMHEGFALWDAQGRLVLYNTTLKHLYADGSEALTVGASYATISEHMIASGLLDTSSEPQQSVEQRVSEHREADGVREIALTSGRILRVTERPTSDGGMVGIYTDITEMRQAAADIRRRAYVDSLTGLANRASFLEQLAANLQRARRTFTSVAVMFIDLDRFKNVNDAFGHETGDALLSEAAARISKCVRASDLVARLGGDEFVVMLVDMAPNHLPTTVAESIINALEQPFVVRGHELFIGASVGVTLFPGDGEDVHELMRNADMAMYDAKSHGRGVLRYFTREMTDRAERYVSLERRLRRAIEARELAIHVQPIVSLADGALVGGEALMRWHPADDEPVSPSEFIAVAEESGLIVSLGEWVLNEACTAAASWTGDDADAPYITVNVSSRQFRAGFGRALVEGALATAGLPPTRLVLEITETVLMDDDQRVREALHELRDLGVGIALDDFGTGYSSLSYLRRFPITTLKIDREFIRDMEYDPSDARLVESVVAMAGRLGVEAVAEGVENTRQAHMLNHYGCPLAQGYHFARPMPAAQFAELVTAQPSKVVA